MAAGVLEFRPWKPAEDLLLAAAWPAGEPAGRLAAELGRTPQAIQKRAQVLGVRRPRAWTPEMDRALREHVGRSGEDVRRLARAWGKTENACWQRARQLGLRSRRWWTREEKAVVRARYGKEDAGNIARDLGRTRYQVHSLARRLGVYRWPRIPRPQIDRVRRLYDRGLSDRAIADRLGVRIGRVDWIRTRYLRKPAHPDPDAKRRAVAKQLKTLGLTSPVQLRTRAFRRFAAENGWPEDLRPREVQVLNVLAAAGGPLTRIQLAAAIGMKSDPRAYACGGSNILAGNGPGGTYTASLARRGLVTILWRAGPRCKERGKGNGRRLNLYTLGPSALAILQERAQWQPSDRQPATAAATAAAP